MDKRKLINVKLDDGTIVPLVHTDNLELVKTLEGYKIQLKPQKCIEKKDYGID